MQIRYLTLFARFPPTPVNLEECRTRQTWSWICRSWGKNRCLFRNIIASMLMLIRSVSLDWLRCKQDQTIQKEKDTSRRQSACCSWVRGGQSPRRVGACAGVASSLLECWNWRQAWPVCCVHVWKQPSWARPCILEELLFSLRPIGKFSSDASVFLQVLTFGNVIFILCHCNVLHNN